MTQDAMTETMTKERAKEIHAQVDFCKAEGILAYLIGYAGSALEYPYNRESATYFFEALSSCLEYYGKKESE